MRGFSVRLRPSAISHQPVCLATDDQQRTTDSRLDFQRSPLPNFGRWTWDFGLRIGEALCLLGWSAPSHKFSTRQIIFPFHLLGQYYDSSYGKAYAACIAWEINSLYGTCYFTSANPKWVTQMRKITKIIFLVILLAQSATAANDLSGEVIGWGHNLGGQATGVPSKDNNFTNGIVKLRDKELTDVRCIAAGVGHALALKNGGTVWGWGNNLSGEVAGFRTEYLQSRTNGQVTIGGKLLTDVVAVSAGMGFSLGLRKDGTVVVWGEGWNSGERRQVMVPSGLSNVIAISAGENISLALKSDGSVIGWGARKIPDGLSNIVAIAAGKEAFSSSLALKKDGTIIEWGPGIYSKNGVEVVSNAVAIAAGSSHCLALLKDGTVWGWGANPGGESIGVPTGADVPKPNGLVTWGANTIPPGVRDIVAIAARGFYCVALKSDGTVVSWFSDPASSAHIETGLSNVISIAAGGSLDGGNVRGMALKKDGMVVVWKSGNPHEEKVPVVASNVVAIAAGGAHSLALRSDGTVVGWGYNGEGQATGQPLNGKPDESNYSEGVVTIKGQILREVTAIAA